MRFVIIILLLSAPCYCPAQIPKPFTLIALDSAHTYCIDTIRTTCDSTFVNVKQFKGDTLLREEGQIWITKTLGAGLGTDTLFHAYTILHGKLLYNDYRNGACLIQSSGEYRYGEMQKGFTITYPSGGRSIYNGKTFDFIRSARPGHSY